MCSEHPIVYRPDREIICKSDAAATRSIVTDCLSSNWNFSGYKIYLHHQQEYGQHIGMFTAALMNNLFLWWLLTFHGLIFRHSKADSLSHLHVLFSALTDTLPFRRIQCLRSKSLVRNFVKNIMNNKLPTAMLVTLKSCSDNKMMEC